MPQRFLKPGLTHSKRFNAVSWFAQALFVRLITLVDDFGRFEADPVLLASLAFPRGGPASVPIEPAHVATALQELSAADLIHLYQVGENPYLHLCRWVERHRSASRYPAIDSTPTTLAVKCQQPASTCCQLQTPPTPTSTPTSTPTMEREKGAAGVMPNGRRPDPVVMEAKKQQWGALNQRITALEQRGNDLTVDQCRELVDMKKRRDQIQKEQARGEFA